MFWHFEVLQNNGHFLTILLYYSLCKTSRKGQFRHFSKSPQFLNIMPFSKPLSAYNKSITLYEFMYKHKTIIRDYFLRFCHFEVLPKIRPYLIILPYYSLCKMSKKGQFRHFSKSRHFFNITSFLKPLIKCNKSIMLSESINKN